MYTGFGLGYGPIVFILQGELLPSDLRSLGSGLLRVFDNISLFIAVKTVPSLIAGQLGNIVQRDFQSAECRTWDARSISPVHLLLLHQHLHLILPDAGDQGPFSRGH